MAKKKNDRPDYNLNWVHFNDKEKSEYTAWISDHPTEPLDCLYAFTEDAVKVSTSQNLNTGSYMVSLTPKDPKSPCRGHVFLFQHNALDKVLLIALFYWSEVLDSGNAFKSEDEDLDW